MADTNLTDAERAELEQLRAEKAKREADAAAAKERAELEALRNEKAAAEAVQAQAAAAQAEAAKEAELDARDAERRERAREIMEPDDDLKMPMAQKVVLFVIAVLIAWFVVYVLIPGMGH